MCVLNVPPRHPLFAATALLFALVLATAPQAQSMLLIGSPVDLYVDGATVEAGQFVDSDATTLIFWEGRRRPKKITVETSAPGQVYGLTTELVFVLGDGNAQGAVDLVDGMLPQDYVRDIKNRKEGFGLIRYTARVAPGQGAGEDVHTVIYTLTDQ